MKLILLAVGRAKGGPEAALVDTYLGRLPWRAEVRELEAKKAKDDDARTAEERRLLAAAIPSRAWVCALDPQGTPLGSEAFAAKLGAARDDGRDTVFLIGGADGLGADLRRRADLVLSFGPMVLAHQIARIVLAEQLYRAHAILSGHPYHRPMGRLDRSPADAGKR